MHVSIQHFLWHLDATVFGAGKQRQPGRGLPGLACSLTWEASVQDGRCGLWDPPKWGDRGRRSQGRELEAGAGDAGSCPCLGAGEEKRQSKRAVTVIRASGQNAAGPVLPGRGSSRDLCKAPGSSISIAPALGFFSWVIFQKEANAQPLSNSPCS